MMQDLEPTQQGLRRILYRFDCPPPLTIGEYVLDLLGALPRTEVARHVLDCSLCDEELTVARAFLATDLVVPTSGAWHELRRVFASLLKPAARPAYGMTRGGEPSGGWEYRAGPVKIVVGAVRGKRRGTISVDGLILHDYAPPESLADREVTLSQTAQPQLPVQTTRTDDLGSFAFEDVVSGTYRLEVTFTEEVIVVEDVHVGS
jgi:hypothetical protein